MLLKHVSSHKLFTIILLIKLSTVPCLFKELSDSWIIKLNGNLDDEFKQFTLKHNFKILNKVGGLDGYYHVRQASNILNRSKRSVLSVNETENLISAHPIVESFTREKVLVRKRRNNVYSTDESFKRKPIFHNLTDTEWNRMWYLNRHSLFESELPDMNVTVVWENGITGRGVKVCFLDDGLEWNHTDLFANYDPKASTDLNDNDDDPMPDHRYPINSHGTRCAGQVAAAANNSFCSVGIAFNVNVGAVRMLDGVITDSIEAHSLSFNMNYIDIYSASWGPEDLGNDLDGPGILAKKAFVEGVTKGRNGLGSIYVWASGNGGYYGDSCACDGYANSVYTITISGVSESGMSKPYYSEECTSTLASTYSDSTNEKKIITTDLNNGCTESHGGSSAAAPIASGIIALTLEANPRLTWRDIMYLIVLTSRPKAIKSNNYKANKRGLLVSTRYGFGLMNAGRMVELAQKWLNVPELHTCSILDNNFSIAKLKPNYLKAILDTNACSNTTNIVKFIEQVEIIVTIRTEIRGKLDIHLTSPSGTKIHILGKRSNDLSSEGFKSWTFMSVHYWGESADGHWKLSIFTQEGLNIFLDEFKIIIHGTETQPVDYEQFTSNHNRRYKRADVSFKSMLLLVFILYFLCLIYILTNAKRFGLFNSYFLLVLILGSFFMIYLFHNHEKLFVQLKLDLNK